MSGKYFNAVHYGVNADGRIDYEEVRRIAKECRPKMIVAGASSYVRAIDFAKFREIADEVGAVLMVDMAHIAGLVAGGEHMSPVPYADIVTTTTHKSLRGPRGGVIMATAAAAEKYNFNKAMFPGIQGGPLMHVIAGKAVCFGEALRPEFTEYAKQIRKNAKALAEGLMSRGLDLVSGGTDNHCMLLDLRAKGLTGRDVQEWFEAANMTTNKNMVPNDPQTANKTSGIRLGTPAVTTRGLKEDDMDQVAEAMRLIIEDHEGNLEAARAIVKSITAKYPLYE